jgi:signal transduction histidine kinase
MDWRGVHRPTIIAFLVLTVLLIGAGGAIYRHLDKLSRLEYENQRRLLSAALQNYRRGFAGTLLDLTRAFEPPIWTQSTEGLQLQLIDRYELLLEEGIDLELIEQLFLVILSVENSERFFRFQQEQGLFVEGKMPAAIADLPGSVLPQRGPRGGRRGISKLELVDGVVYLVIPHYADRRGFGRWRRDSLPNFPPPPLPGSRTAPDRSEPSDLEGQPRFFLILLKINHVVFERDILVPLEESLFRRPLLPGIEVALVSDSGEGIFYRGDGSLDASYLHSADAILPLVAPGGWLFPFDFTMAPRQGEELASGLTGRLNLIARHHAGSLQTAINRRRAYDLLEAFGILLLLAGAAVTLILSVQKTRRLAKRQMDFVAGISHELRNPLTAIQSAGFNLSRGTVHEEEKVEKYGQIISRESRRLTQLVEQVLSYAGIQRSERQYEKQLIHLEEVLESVLQEYSHILDEDGWNVKVQIDEDLPPLSADPKAIRSCVSNLIDNVLKYASEIKSLWIKASSDKGCVELSVKDRGQGIPQAELSQIFEPFFRGSTHVASVTPGTGLGLALVKSHVDAHGGRVTVESKPGEGSSFTLVLPLPETGGRSNGA